MLGYSITLLSALLVAAASLVAILTTVFVLEIVAATWPYGRTRTLQSASGLRPRIAVLVPAHNEGPNLLPTLADINAQLAPNDRLLVVADNCSDDTAAVANHAGAEVIERKDSSKTGKGFALDYGVRHLERDPPAILVVIDADCRLSSHALDQLAQTTSATGRPAQALYLMTAPTGSAINYQVAEFAWRIKNWVRPLGLHAVNLPCQLVGTGMAFPWSVIQSATLATAHLVEDLNLGLDLAAAGRPPVFCPRAVVKSSFPPTLKGALSQRERWEHGHVGLSLARAPKLIGGALRSGNFGLLALALDIAIPPLTLVGYSNALVLLGTSFGALFGAAPVALCLTGTSVVAFTLAICLAWLTHGRDVLPASSALRMGSYIFAKLGFYWRLLAGGPVSQWTRTDRK